MAANNTPVAAKLHAFTAADLGLAQTASAPSDSTAAAAGDSYRNIRGASLELSASWILPNGAALRFLAYAYSSPLLDALAGVVSPGGSTSSSGFNADAGLVKFKYWIESWPFCTSSGSGNNTNNNSTRNETKCADNEVRLGAVLVFASFVVGFACRSRLISH